MSLDQVERAREWVAPHVTRTPCVAAEWLGAGVRLKCENLQITGSFKVRGPLARLRILSEEERRRGVIAASAGNHGKGLAWAARRYGISCVVCVPRTIPENKERAIRELGAEVVKTEFDGYDETQDRALLMARETGRVWVSPFDDDWIMAGNGGTTALEVFEDAGGLDALVVPCGGGGLAIGAGVVARAKAPGVKLIGVNTEASPGMWLSRRDGRAHLKLPWRPTIAEGIEGGVSQRTYELGLKYIDDVVVVREESIRRAVAEVWRRHHMAVEGSAAAVVAAVLEGVLPQDLRRVCLVLTGSNIDRSRFDEIAGSNEGGV